MTESFNGTVFGLAGVPAGFSNGYGLDVRVEREDELDSECCAFVAEELRKSGEAPRVLDLGCGAFGQSWRLARLGANVVAVDKNSNLIPIYEAIKRLYPTVRLTYLSTSVSDLEFTPTKSNFVAVYSQRMLHYLTYHQAREMLIVVKRLLAPGGRCFLSVSGLKSELGDSYAHANRPVADRFSELSADVAKAHEMLYPVCLYTEAEFRELLVVAELNIVRIWTSEFGNIKAICDR